MEPDVIVVGGGVAGLAATAALGSAGLSVNLLEGRPHLGGRATSYALPGTGVIDNCQHILLRCCVNLLDFYGRMGVADRVEFWKDIPFIEPGGRVSHFQRGLLPAPLHFTESFFRMTFLSWADKAVVARGFLAILWERGRREDLDEISMLDWLREKGQTPTAIERFWRQVLVSAINEELDRMAASHGFQVFWLGFLASATSYEMGVPTVPLVELYTSSAWSTMPRVQIELRTPVERVLVEDGRACGVVVNGEARRAKVVVSAVPFEKVSALVPEAGVDVSAFTHSSITGVHFWFDQSVTDLPHGTLLDRNLQWFFSKDGGRYLQLVVSASKPWLKLSRQDVIDTALAELKEFLPLVRQAKLVGAQVVKEARATYSALPGLGKHRPSHRTKLANFVLAGDWTRSGWASTMEGAARSGYGAAEVVTEILGRPQRFLLPDIA
jgi:squalene-associated FAD-dependent desaturase